MKAVILAGGKGTRLGLKDLPKPMVPVAGKPLLEHQLELLKKYNITEVIFLSGFMAEKIEEYFGNGDKWGVKITHIKEKKALGTAGALKQLESILDERFLVLYGDVMMDFDIQSFINFDKEDCNSIGSIIIHPNDHPYDSDLVDIDEDNFVKTFLSKPHPEGLVYSNCVNAAVYILSTKIFEYIPNDIACDFGKDIFPAVVKEGRDRIKAYNTPEYIKDLGTPDRLHKVESAFLNGSIARRNKKFKRSAIFIDRDGVIIEDADNLRKVEQLKLIPDVEKAIQIINKSEYLAIVITNQPVIAKGWLSFDGLLEIHKTLETLLGKERVYLDKIYYCPHHPDGGFEGEVKSLKIQCDCRKPNTGMIEKAIKEFNIDLSTSFFIGDTTTDIQTGINVGVKTILVKTGYAGNDEKYNVRPDFEAKNLHEAVNLIMNYDNK